MVATPGIQSGFRIIENILSHEECDNLLEPLSTSKLDRGRAGARHLMSVLQVAELANDIRLLEIARSILGKEPTPFRATLFDKSRVSNWLVVWHQDTALPLKNPFDATGWGPWSQKAGVAYAHAPAWALSQVLALRVHLDASTRWNGPLRVVPASHTAGVLTDDEISALVKARGLVECLVPKGGILAMSPLLIHSSSKVTTDIPRRVLHIEYTNSLSLGPGIELAVA
jgi:ectoine hydroxylase-related dioxygenase (phytanoyl-CoA dioxygenase family)